MKNLSLPIFVFLLFGLQACYQDSDDKRECGSACSLDFISVNVLISDDEGNPVALDRFEVIKVATGEEITIMPGSQELELMRENGSYPIINDNYLGPREEFEVNFKGFIGDEVVADENYIVGKDCCHVYYASGDLELVISLPGEPTI